MMMRFWFTPLTIAGILATALTALASPISVGVAEAVDSPPKVTGITTGSRTSTTITLSWNASTGASGYFLQKRESSSSSWVSQSGSATTRRKISSLGPSTSYDFRVSAYKCAGSGDDEECSNNDPWSDTYTERTRARPPAPTATPTPVPPVYFTAEWPVFNFANVAPAATDGEVVVRLRWSNVEGANAYRVVRRAAGETTSSVADGEIQFDAREYTETVAATGKSVEFQVQGVIEGGSSGATAVVGGRTITVAKNTQKYGPFSDTVALLLSAERNNPLAEGDDLPPDAEGIPPIREFFRTLGETVGIEAERMDGWAVLMWFIFSAGAAAALMAGTSAATGGEFVGPLPMGMGMLVMGLLWGVAGPVYAGVPWQFALTPLALMVVSGIIMARTRRMIP